MLLTAALAGAIVHGNARWDALTQQLNARLEAARVAPTPALYDAARELDGLPVPVQRYFRAALADGVPIVGAITLAEGAIRVTLAFCFAADTGLIESVRADARGRSVGSEVVSTPWEGRWHDCQQRDGLRVPMRGEVAWLLPDNAEGRKPYWRGAVTALRFE